MSAHGQPVSRLIIDYIDENYALPISLRDVARAFGYSACHLTHRFRCDTGMPITAWIIKRRILAAQHLLGQANVDVATACAGAGFNDLCYFTRQFVRHVGMTPGRFRSAMNASRMADLRLPNGGYKVEHVAVEAVLQG
jgi:AraC family transcriptional regulator, transcriptional activator of pobA